VAASKIGLQWRCSVCVSNGGFVVAVNGEIVDNKAAFLSGEHAWRCRLPVCVDRDIASKFVCSDVVFSRCGEIEVVGVLVSPYPLV
jgi:hypothetical protein